MPTITRLATVMQSPDPGLGGSAMESPTLTGYSLTNILHTTNGSENKSIKWSGFQGIPGGRIIAIRVLFDWDNNGECSGSAEQDESFDARASFVVTATGVGSVVNSFNISSCIGIIGTCNDFDPFDEGGPVNASISANTPISSIEVAANMDAGVNIIFGPNGTGIVDFDTQISNLRLEVDFEVLGSPIMIS